MDKPVGLCEKCIHMQKVANDRGSTFYRCGKSDADPRYPKYPRLPVLRCAGYKAEELTKN